MSAASRRGITFVITWRRLTVLLIVTVALAVAIGFVVNTLFGVRNGGSLSSRPGSRVQVGQQVEHDRLYSWGMSIPENDTGQDIRIDSVDPLGIDGIDVVGVTLTDGSIGTAYGYPPEAEEYEDIELMLPAGAVLPAGSGPQGLTMLFGVRLKDDRETGTIGGIRLRYHVGRRAYEVVYPWSLRLLTPEAYERERQS